MRSKGCGQFAETRYDTSFPALVSKLTSIISSRCFFFNKPFKRDPHLCPIMTFQHIAHKLCMHIQLYLQINPSFSNRNTISNAPRMTPQRTFEYHKLSYGPSSGNSTKSAKGFSSNIKEKDFSSAAHKVTVGVMLRYILNAI
jgi:hypothetical protein